MMVVLNTETGNEVARLRAAGECDDVFFDASRKRIYVIGGKESSACSSKMIRIITS